MNQEQFQECKKRLKKCLDRPRYQHTLGVMYSAASLAMCYGEDIDRAMLAGLLHDSAKCIPNSEKIILCKANKIPVSRIELQNPGLLHAKLGAFIAKNDFLVTDSGILHAIEYHTTGCPQMSLLDKIIYIADLIEPWRNGIPNLELARAMAFKNLDECLYQILENSLSYIKTRNASIDPMTEETYLYYKNILNK